MHEERANRVETRLSCWNSNLSRASIFARGKKRVSLRLRGMEQHYRWIRKEKENETRYRLFNIDGIVRSIRIVSILV